MMSKLVSKLMSKSKLAILGLLLIGSALQTACGPGQIVASVIGAEVGLAVVADVATRCHTETRRRGAFDKDNNHYWVYSEVEVCRQPNGYGGYYFSPMSLETKPAATFKVSTVAAAYGLTEANASKMMSSLLAAQNAKDDAAAREALSAICLDVETVKALAATGQEPTESMINCVSLALDQKTEDTKSMISSLTAKVRENVFTKSRQNQTSEI